MTTRHTRALAVTWQRARENERIAYHALISSLDEYQRRVYEYISHEAHTNSWWTDQEIASRCDWLVEDAKIVLAELWAFAGLLEREEVVTDSGREFRYRLAR